MPAQLGRSTFRRDRARTGPASGPRGLIPRASASTKLFGSFFLALFWAWAGVTFYNNRFDIDDFTHRGLVFLTMFAMGGMAMTAPKARRRGGASRGRRPFCVSST